MELEFKAKIFFPADDGTLVSPFLNAKDANCEVPWNFLEGVNLAQGKLKPKQRSAIHVHPFVEHVTFVLSGRVELIIKDPEKPEQYTLELGTHQAAVTRPGSFQQFVNPLDSEVETLYIVSPPFQFEPGKGKKPAYTDAIIVGESWDTLKAQNWMPPQLADPAYSFTARRRSAERIQRSKAK
jgi:mannose-6-phosphate isomerase-like protein (cupin superfamily)